MRNYDRGIICCLFITLHFDQAYSTSNENWEWTFYRYLTTWNDGTRFCHSKGGRIVNINNQAKKNILLEFRNEIGGDWGDPVWMGVYYNSLQNMRFWQGVCTDADNYGYNNWESDLPSASKECVMMDGGSMRWKPEVCNQEYVVICEKPIDSTTACLGFNKNDDNGNLICVKGVVDTSTALPKDHLSRETVFDPPCFPFSEFVVSPMTSAEPGDPVTTTLSHEQTTTIYDLSMGDMSTENSAGVTLITSEGSVGNTNGMTELPSTSEGYISTQSTLSSTVVSDPSGTTLYQSTTTNIPFTCECNCSSPINMTQEELMEKLKELRSILSIVKKDTVKSKLKLISVRDDRPSSTAIGSLGIILIILVVALVVSIDSINLITILQKSNYKEKTN